jgi:hypothetical protein
VRSNSAANTLDLLDESARSRVLLEVEKNLAPVRCYKLLLVRTGVESNDTETDSLRVLNGKVTD